MSEATLESLLDTLKRAGGKQVPVMALDDILVTKLLALDEHNADYADLLSIGRALREQIEWAALRQRTSSSPFAEAFFVLADGLEISPFPASLRR